MNQITWLLFLLLIPFIGIGQNKNYNISGESKTDTISFTLTEHNNISIKAFLNQKDTVTLMFHTAANSISLTEKATERLDNLTFNEPEEMKSWGGGGSSRNSENNSLQIGNFQWDSLTIWENRHSGPGTDGKFGPNLFKDKVVEIDFEQELMMLHSKLPNLEEGFQKLKLIFNRSFMFIEGNCKIGEQLFSNQFLIHTGYAGTLLFDDEFVKKHKLGEQVKIISESKLKDSAGNKLTTKKGILPAFSIGKTEFSNLPIGFFEGAIGRQKMSVMGGDLLKRFHIVFDVRNEHIYLKINDLKNSGFADL